jgi:cold shock CspA family protein
MDFPIQISFRNVEPSPSVQEWVEQHANKLTTFHQRIIRCRVAIEMDHRHLRRGNRHLVKVLLSVPGRQLVARNLAAPVDPEKLQVAGRKVKRSEIGAGQKQLRVAITQAFRAAGRQLQDLLRAQRGEVKVHKESLAKVAEIFREHGYGFLETLEGRRIYFHKNSVLNNGFARLAPGAAVRFVEESGDHGPQASTVEPVRRVRQRRPRRRAA